MKLHLPLLLSCLLLSSPAQAADPASSPPPNVLLLFSDDQGSIDMNIYGATDLRTPHMDALARRGVRFTQFYAAAPVCSPSRAGLLTGRYPFRAGMPGNAPSQQGKPGLPPSEITIAETFKAAGYATAHIGKWHLGYTPETMPNGQGFDYSFGHMGGCIDNYSHFFYWDGPNRHDLWRNGQAIQQPGRFFPDLMVEEASGFMETNRHRPFFIYFAMNVPHYPYQGDPEWLEHYRDLPYPRDLYAAFLSTLDARIGQLLAKLEALGLSSNTIVVYQSDHGHSTEERAHFGGGNAGPYRGAKFSLFEGGLRVPAIISWPGHLPASQTRAQIAHGCDWLPTLAELCGVPLLNKDLDGRSLVRVIRSAEAPSPHAILHWTIGNSWAVRRGDWKLMGNARDTSSRNPQNMPLFLANLANDVSEQTDHSEHHPDIVRQLKTLHEEWARNLRSAGTP